MSHRLTQFRSLQLIAATSGLEQAISTGQRLHN